jgi:hypothetical protein
MLRKSLAPRETGFRVWLIGRSGHLVSALPANLNLGKFFLVSTQCPDVRRRFDNTTTGMQGDRQAHEIFPSNRSCGGDDMTFRGDTLL